ncbi:hypothetical protein RSOL_369280, partial [Rhizoctonia solani AG-3 Rhs1AP]
MSDLFVDLVQAQLDELIANVPEDVDELDESTVDLFFTELDSKVTADENLATEFSGNQAEPTGPRPAAVELKVQPKSLIKVIIPSPPPSNDRTFVVQTGVNPG